MDGGDSDVDIDPDDLGDLGYLDPACRGGSRADRCRCSCGEELGHLNGKMRRLEELVRLLVADAGLASWEESRRVGNLKCRLKSEREVADREHVRRVEAERAAGEEKKRVAKRVELARLAEEARKSQVEADRIQGAQRAAANDALAVAVEDCSKATTPEELVPRAAKVAEAAAGVECAEVTPSPASEEVDVGGGGEWWVVGW